MAGSAPGVQTAAQDGLRWWHVPALCGSVGGKALSGWGCWGGALRVGTEPSASKEGCN